MTAYKKHPVYQGVFYKLIDKRQANTYILNKFKYYSVWKNFFMN